MDRRRVIGTPKLGDVAKAAKLSSAAVSRYLNGSLRLPPETARRIDVAVKSLDYRPHPHARSLSRGKSDTLGLLLPDIANPFFARLAAAIEAAADDRGLAVMLCTSLNKPHREIDYLAQLRRNLVDGVILATNHPDDGSLARAVNEAASVVLVDEDIEGTDVFKVFCDNEHGGALAAQHLLSFGHLRFAYVGGPQGLMSARMRGAGFAASVRDGGGCVIAERFGDYSRAHGEAATRDILDRFPDVTAIFAGSDEILTGMLRVLREGKRVVGDDISVVTFDDVGPLDLMDPPITAIRQPVEAIGRLAIERMLDGTPGSGTDRLHVSLISRASVAAPRTRAARRRVASL